MAKKTIRKYAQLSVYPSVKKEIARWVALAKKDGGDPNVSRIIRRAFMALEEKESGRIPAQV